MNDMDRELQELMSAEMDGTATAEQSTRLRGLLDTRPEAAAEFRRLRGVVLALDHLGMEDPPASLEQNVMRAVRTSAHPRATGIGWLATVGAWMGAGLGFRGFAMGAALGVLAFGLLSGSIRARLGSDSRPWTGSMLPLGSERVLPVLGRNELQLPHGSMVAEALGSPGGVALRLSGDVPAGTEVFVSFDPGAWSATSLRQMPAGNEVMLGSGRLSVRMLQPGHCQYLLELARKGPAGSPFRILVHSPDGQVQGELDSRALRSGS
jgi:hypothetical protein